jgi:hypothetical protein
MLRYHFVLNATKIIWNAVKTRVMETSVAQTAPEINKMGLRLLKAYARGRKTIFFTCNENEADTGQGTMGDLEYNSCISHIEPFFPS